MPEPVLYREESESQESQVLLYSAGIDSFSIDYIIDPDVRLFIEDAAERVSDERSCAEALPRDVEFLELDLEEFTYDADVMPLREWIQVMYGLQYGNEVVLGGVKSDTMPTLHHGKVESFSSAIEECTSAIHGLMTRSVSVPFADTRKSKLVEMALDAGAEPEDFLEYTRSCDYGGAEECGECMACVRKAASLELNGISARKEFESDPLETLQEHYTGEEVYGFSVDENDDLIEWISEVDD